MGLAPNWQNRTMWTGDNLNIKRGMNSESVDLIYLDPPFNSNRNYAAIDAAGLTHGKGMKSYLILMAVRLLEMRRLLNDTGLLYLHCDPTQPLPQDAIGCGVWEGRITAPW